MWTAISAIATALYTVVFIVSLRLIYHQLRSMQISTTATAFSKALEILQNEEIRKDRKAIFALQNVPFEEWDESQKLAGERVIHTYDQVGIMIRAKMFNKQLIVDSWGNSLRMAKPLLMPLVLEYRSKWKSEEIWNEFEWLCNEAEKLQTKMKEKK
jgi:hypothetical protein